MKQPTLKEQVVSFNRAMEIIHENPKQANAIRRGLGTAPAETLVDALRRRGKIIQAGPATVAVVPFDWAAYDKAKAAYDKAVAQAKQAKARPRKKLSKVQSKATRKSR